MQTEPATAEKVIPYMALPGWVYEGVKVVIVHPLKNEFAEGEVVRIEGKVAKVISPEWPGEKEFVIGRATSRSLIPPLDEVGRQGGFHRPVNCFPADCQKALALYAKRARQESLSQAQAACARFAARPGTTAGAREAIKALEAFLGVMEGLRK
jgi:hypothetical protein